MSTFHDRALAKRLQSEARSARKAPEGSAAADLRDRALDRAAADTTTYEEAFRRCVMDDPDLHRRAIPDLPDPMRRLYGPTHRSRQNER